MKGTKKGEATYETAIIPISHLMVWMVQTNCIHSLNHPSHKYQRLTTLERAMNASWLLQVRSSEKQTLGGR